MGGQLRRANKLPIGRVNQFRARWAWSLKGIKGGTHKTSVGVVVEVEGDSCGLVSCGR
jgi:hypothetical protein